MSSANCGKQTAMEKLHITVTFKVFVTGLSGPLSMFCSLVIQQYYC